MTKKQAQKLLDALDGKTPTPLPKPDLDPILRVYTPEEWSAKQYGLHNGLTEEETEIVLKECNGNS